MRDPGHLIKPNLRICRFMLPDSVSTEIQYLCLRLKANHRRGNRYFISGITTGVLLFAIQNINALCRLSTSRQEVTRHQFILVEVIGISHLKIDRLRIAHQNHSLHDKIFERVCQAVFSSQQRQRVRYHIPDLAKIRHQQGCISAAISFYKTGRFAPGITKKIDGDGL